MPLSRGGDVCWLTAGLQPQVSSRKPAHEWSLTSLTKSAWDAPLGHVQVPSDNAGRRLAASAFLAGPWRSCFQESAQADAAEGGVPDHYHHAEGPLDAHASNKGKPAPNGNGMIAASTPEEPLGSAGSGSLPPPELQRVPRDDGAVDFKNEEYLRKEMDRLEMDAEISDDTKDEVVAAGVDMKSAEKLAEEDTVEDDAAADPQTTEEPTLHEDQPSMQPASNPDPDPSTGAKTTVAPYVPAPQ
eukprot:gb/GFBE01036866.1/.p1 GENE.gb/GFBE01036866.1/~~gb/GFBE01036866.1/.p1  ORF type:complete len:243 (+),score=38.60 gb/GFBE01036866.1/:1-729(+)